MKDWKSWFDMMSIVSDPETWKGEPVRATISIEEERYQAYKARLIEEGFIEANPKRWVRPVFADVLNVFIDKLCRDKPLKEITDLAERFFDHWDSVDWMDGKKRVKSVNGRINTWIKNNEKYKKSNGNGLASYDNDSTNWG